LEFLIFGGDPYHWPGDGPQIIADPAVRYAVQHGGIPLSLYLFYFVFYELVWKVEGTLPLAHRKDPEAFLRSIAAKFEGGNNASVAQRVVDEEDMAQRVCIAWELWAKETQETAGYGGLQRVRLQPRRQCTRAVSNGVDGMWLLPESSLARFMEVGNGLKDPRFG
jgi:hypothetical protein